MNIIFQESRLRNGIRVATADMPQVGSVAMGVWVGVGGRHESRRQAGISHFIEHLLFKGTRTRTARQVSQIIEGRGGYFNAFTQEESTCYYARIADEHTDRVFDVLSDMYRHPRFDPDDIRRERGVIIEEIMMYRDRPQSRVEDLLAELMWPNHPLGRALIGTPESVRRIGRRDILQFKNKKYVPGNTVVVFAGKVDHDRCVEWVEERMGDLAAKSPPPYRPVSGRVRQRAAAIQTKDIEQAHLAMGVRLFGRYDRRRYALKMLSVILGENMSSRLFQRVREQHGLAYAVHSSVQLFKETGLLEIQAGLDRSRTARALDLIVRELARLREQPVSAQELRRAKDYAKGQLLISLENSISQMMWVGENLMGYGRFIQPARVIEELERVGARDIQAVAREVLRVGKISTALIVPTQDTLAPDTVARILGRLG